MFVERTRENNKNLFHLLYFVQQLKYQGMFQVLLCSGCTCLCTFTHAHTHTHTHVCCKRELERDSLTYASSSVADVGGKWGQLGIGINEPSFDSWSAPKTYFIILGLQSTPFRAWCLFIHIAISSFITLVIYFPQSVSIPLLKQGSLFIHLTTHRAKLFEIVYL